MHGPYQGLTIDDGGAANQEMHFLDDFGLGWAGIPLYMATEMMVGRMTGGKGMAKILRKSQKAAYRSLTGVTGFGLKEPGAGSVHRFNVHASAAQRSGQLPQEARRYMRLKKDLKGSRLLRGKGNVAEALMQKGGSLRNMSQSYGRGAAAKIYGAATAGRLVRGAAVIPLMHAFVGMGRSMAESIMDWEPQQADDPRVQFGGYYADTRTAMTQRQASIQAIHNSGIAARSALANEAAHIHS